ncbi:hypothetical protein [Carnobacterium inhibens]|uniref:Uncharacterized protein n=1 Tax=Carnobacterium inhibens subsp. gilichinskyi TaxID=1266845 RepID=U5SFZ6_9LACT|nr:hypothetical protein [Carnobacterium inhibens]AGY82802.1 hypothetical protein Q783_05905 [Carnobacterium inhibens subsp. gilichinskyi]
MKKLGFLLVFVVVLAGCDVGQLAEKITEGITSTSESAGSIVSSGEESSEPESSIGEKETSISIQSSSEETKETVSDDLRLVPQADEIKNELTVETDATLALLDDYVKQNPDMGYEDDVTVIYTGETFGESPNLAGIFFIINRTDTAMKNIRFTYTFGKSENELVFDEHAFKLTEESFGILEPNTVMPMYLVVDPTKEDLLKNMESTQVVEEINSFDYEEANKSETSISSDTSTEQKQTEGADLSFVIPKENADKGQTLDNNPLMAQFEQLVSENPDMGFDNDVTVMYSGVYDEVDGNTLAYFFVINKTELTLKNIHYKLNYGNKDGEMVWDQNESLVAEEIFGPLEPNAVLPLTMTVPKDKVDLFFSITNENLSIWLDDFTYEEL